MRDSSVSRDDSLSIAQPAPAANFTGNAARAARRRPLFLAAAVGATWLALLAVLAALTANPVTLNRDQVLRAKQIVTAQVVDADAGECAVEKQWLPGPLLKTIVVRNLGAAGVRTGGSYLLLLLPTAGTDFRLVPTRLPDQRPLVYPATHEALEQLEQLLNGE